MDQQIRAKMMIVRVSMSISMMMMMISVTKSAPITRNSHIARRDLLANIAGFCKGTTNPVLCSQTIQPHLQGGTVDPVKALDVEVDATLGEAKKTLTNIQTLENQQNTKSTKDSLDICRNQYKSMLDAIVETKAAIAKKDIVGAKFKFSAVISYQSACQDSFKDGKIPFTKESNIVYQLGGNCLDIIAAIDNASPHKPLPPLQQTPSAFSNVIGTVS
ncbi:hypothetical protein VNO78_04438 [Psophocarpus tetragonolobus]|uniref:Pectinesterase inhibitor domain-containing protein n=1 Tax=Psophocarpus tetragonolobus TaxID=3891 RepID=A0AAN9XXH2_PSOTE